MRSGKYIQNLAIKDNENFDNTSQLVFYTSYKDLSKDKTKEIFKMLTLSELFKLWYPGSQKIWLSKSYKNDYDEVQGLPSIFEQALY